VADDAFNSPIKSVTRTTRRSRTIVKIFCQRSLSCIAQNYSRSLTMVKEESRLCIATRSIFDIALQTSKIGFDRERT